MILKRMHPEIHCGFSPKNDATVILSVIVNHCLISWARFSSYQGWVPSTVSTHSLLPLYVRPCFTKHRSNQRGPLLKIYQNKPNPKILPLQIMSGGISYSPTVWKTSMFLNDLIKTSKQRSMLCFFWGGRGIQPNRKWWVPLCVAQASSGMAFGRQSPKGRCLSQGGPGWSR